VRVIGYRVPQDGKDIQLTIDIRLQKLVGELISDQRAAIIIMNPHTGEILALASSPGFNPNIFIENSGYSIKDILSDSRSPLLNRAISGIYPAGSLFKVVVATAALENITHIPKFFCPGSINIGKRTYKCWNLHEEEDIVEAIIHSCNVFFYRLGLLLGPDLIAEYAHKFGLGNPSGIDLPYEKAGFIPTPFWKRIKRLENWYDGDTANLAIGQGELLITPLQAVRLMAVFANGGKLVTPHLIYALQGRQIKPPQVINLRLKDKTLSLMKMALKRVIADPSGTAYIAYKEDLEIAGKTGSAQVTKGRAHGWFAGFCPAKEPKIAFVVFLENGEAGYYACVLARQLFERMLSEGLL
jgi:penicillin-binding protein 2